MSPTTGARYPGAAGKDAAWILMSQVPVLSHRPTIVQSAGTGPLRAVPGRTTHDGTGPGDFAAVNGRWTFPILRHLASGESRPADLLTAINASAPGGRLSRKVLLETLRRMSQSGMIRRQETPAGLAKRITG